MIGVDLFIGRRLRLDGVRHRIVRFEGGAERLILVVEDGSSRLVSIARADLYARLCVETAVLESPFSVWEAA